MSTLTVTCNVAIAGDKTLSASSGHINAEATSQINIDLVADGNSVTVELQPSSADQVYVLLLSSTHYSSHLTYVFSDGTSDSPSALTLDGPHLYSAGNLSAVGVNPTHIKFTMTPSGEDASISLFVARDATP